MRAYLVSLISGFFFAIGLGLSGMTQPAYVVGFLDIFGQWNPALLFVMGGAVTVYATVFFLIRRKTTPFFGAKLSFPTRKDIDRPLVVGAAIFGIGWGIGGLCPGPALVSLVTGASSIWLFVGFMVLGMVAGNWVQNANKDFPQVSSRENVPMGAERKS